MSNEADTCRKFILPKLLDAGWETPPHQITEQQTFTDGRIIVTGGKVRRGKQKRADYLLRYTRDYPIAVVEAKADYKSAGDGLQQAKDYAETIGLSFAYASNGAEILEFDYLTGIERQISTFPRPDDLWARLRATDNIDEASAKQLLTPAYYESGKRPRYYQEIAINRTVEAILQGRKRLLLTMATGTGKTMVAFQICWKLWSARWNRTAAHRRPKILYLADRNILIDDPKDKDFAPFGDARWKIENGQIQKGREMYFAIYQAIAQNEARPGLYREYSPEFFDLIIVDECHRGSAREDSNWREILEYFAPAVQLGMTATPLRADNRNTYTYFGDPLYEYSLRQGIEDGFLAPYRVHRVVTTWDAAGWRPSKGELDRFGQAIPDDEYQTKDFEKVVSLRARTDVIAAHLSDFMARAGRMDKTIVFCVDQEHADDMRRALNNRNADLVRQHPDFVCRVTADEGSIGRGHLDKFKDLETTTPVILTTSQLLTTGVDAPTCKNVVLARVVGSMTEFKQIIGRGTRVRDDYGKLFFNILDYTGTATRMFADPSFDGYPVDVTVEELDDKGTVVATVVEPPVEEFGGDGVAEGVGDGYDAGPHLFDHEDGQKRRKYYVDGGQVEIAAHLVYELDPDGKQLRVVRFIDYTAEKVRVLYPNAADLRVRWADPEQRAAIIEQLAERGIDFEDLAGAADQPDADPFDLLCHVAFNAPLRTRRERAERLRRELHDFFEQYGAEARAILNELLEKYAEFGTAQFVLPDVLKVSPISTHGNVSEIAELFGGAALLRAAIYELQTRLYSAA
ncbi:MAG TPA: DEAD/DEAH box helicase family protein [Candidatus Baltobacteraceae bacterium]|nr:DEAD/DEAH box helicase family protein [Candidatus Baltobacteraceae bacterium]